MPNKIITILIPCLNEEKIIGDVIDDCWIGLSHNKSHQILIMDSGDDNSAKIATEKGAQVVKTIKRGLGQAYIESLPYIKGDYIVMGDADKTYDFKETPLFINKLDQGYQFVMGTRTKGWIEKNAMPKLHRYFGSPITNWILNFIYGSHFSDIHCGMRGITKEALLMINLQSTQWQYASEMIIKSIQLNLKSTEIPIHFYKDKKGRISHVKRQGFWTPWKAGWISLQAMFTYGAEFFLFKPGILLIAIGLPSVLALTLGPIGSFYLYSMLLAMTLSIIGFILLIMGIISKIISDYKGEKHQLWLERFSYNKIVISCVILSLTGTLLILPLLSDFIKYGFTLPFGIKNSYYSSVTGLMFIIISFIAFTSTLVIHSLIERLKNGKNY